VEPFGRVAIPSTGGLIAGELRSMTVRDTLSWITGTLRSAGIESAEVEAGWMLWRLSGLSPVQLRLRGDRPVPDEEHRRLEGWVERRRRREPLQHILGTAPFLEWELEVSPDVLVPRPETEVLALRAQEGLRQRSGAVPGRPLRALDIGTGSGCLAIALARVPGVSVSAIDVSEAALRIARSNATRLGFPAIGFLRQDLREASPSTFRDLDLIVSNPPYIPTGEIAGLDPEVRDHDPRSALDGGPDGLEFYRILARCARHWLRPSGVLLAEFGDGQGPDLVGLFAREGWREISTEKDLSARERILIVHPPAAGVT
jgi:release factor glutamine methyltransferase